MKKQSMRMYLYMVRADTVSTEHIQRHVQWTSRKEIPGYLADVWPSHITKEKQDK